MNRFTRRTFVATAAAAALAALPVGAAAALSSRSAKALVDKVVADINTIINSGKPEDAMLRDFEDIFVNYADVSTIARYTLGVDARSMSDAQLKRYTKAFQGYIARKYGRRFREFIGGKIEVTGAHPVKSFIEVSTVARLKGMAPFEVSFMISDRGGDEKFFNMYIEGVNLLLSERTEIQAMLDARRGNVDRLIRDLDTVG